MNTTRDEAWRTVISDVIEMLNLILIKTYGHVISCYRQYLLKNGFSDPVCNVILNQHKKPSQRYIIRLYFNSLMFSAEYDVTMTSQDLSCDPPGVCNKSTPSLNDQGDVLT